MSIAEDLEMSIGAEIVDEHDGQDAQNDDGEEACRHLPKLFIKILHPSP